MAVQAAVLQTFATLSLVCCISPLMWHIKGKNVAATALIIWTIFRNIFCLVNAGIWSDENTAAWWNGSGFCDVQVRFLVASSIGVAGSLAAMLRNLAYALRINRSSLSKSHGELRRDLIIDLTLCYIWPFVVSLLAMIVQPGRYYVVSYVGCSPILDDSWLKVPILLIWGPLFCIIAIWYAGLVLYRMNVYRAQFSEILRNSNSALNKNRFLRLFIASLSLILLYLPITIYTLYRNVTEAPVAAFSWSRTHSPEWNTLILFATTNGEVSFDSWTSLLVGIFLFILFGLGKDAVDMYRTWAKKTRLDKAYSLLTSRSSSTTLWSHHHSEKDGKSLRNTSVASQGSGGTLGFNTAPRSERPDLPVCLNETVPDSPNSIRLVDVGRHVTYTREPTKIDPAHYVQTEQVHDREDMV